LTGADADESVMAPYCVNNEGSYGCCMYFKDWNRFDEYHFDEYQPWMDKHKRCFEDINWWVPYWR